MSYILDALKKSEQARQRGAPVSHYSLWPVVDEEVGQKRWPYWIAALLAGNALLLGYWLRPAVSAEQHVTAPIASTPLAASAPPAPVVKEQIAAVAPGSSDETRMPAPPANSVNEVALKREAEVGAVPLPVVEPTQPPKPQASDRVKPSATAKTSAEAAQTGASTAKAVTKNRTAMATADSVTPAKPKVDDPPKSSQAADSGKKSEPNETVRIAHATPSAQAVAKQNGKPDAPAQTNPSTAKTNEQANTGNRDELPAVLQKELPALAVSGFIRDGEAEGMVIVNDRLVRAGDEVAPGVKLEKIMKDNLVFTYKGYRFTR